MQTKDDSGEKTKAFFPEFLNEGSSGPAVAVLQLLLKALGFDHIGISITGDYREKTAEAVKNLQKKMGLEPDGHFGPATRAALKNSYGIDVDAIPANIMAGKTNAIIPQDSLVGKE